MFRLLAIASLFALVVAPTNLFALNQVGSRIDRDIAFAERLTGYYPDLAEDFLSQLEKLPNLKDEDKARVSLVRADIFSRKAGQEVDLNKKVEMLQQSVATIEGFLKNYPNHPSAAFARSRIGDLGREFGEVVADAIQNESDPKKIEAMRNQAEKYFKDAEEFARKRIEKGANPEADPIDVEYASARFNLPKTQFRHALLFEQKHPQRSFLLNEALKNIEGALFDLGLEDYAPTYDAQITQGLILKEKGDWNKAKDAFESAVNMKVLYEDPENPGKFEWDDVGPAIIGTAFYELCKGANAVQDYLTVIDASDRCFKMLPEIRNDDLGWRIMLERAKALGATGQSEEAQKLAQEVIRKNARGYYGALARELFSSLLGDAENASPSQLLSGAGAERSKGNTLKAMDYLRKAIRKSAEKPEWGKFATDAYVIMAQYLDQDRRDEESVLAFLQAAALDKDPNSKVAPRMLFSAATNLTQLSGSTNSAFYEGLYQKTVKQLTEKYPKSPETTRASMLVARKHEAKNQWEEAIKIYENFKPSDVDIYAEAVNRSASCYFNLARSHVRQAKPDQAKIAFEKAEQYYRKALDFSANEMRKTNDEERQGRLRDAAFGSISQIAEIYLNDAVNKPGDVLKLLDGIEKNYPAQAADARVSFLRLRALIDLNRLSEAASEMDKLLLKAPANQRGLSVHCRRLAAQFERDAEEIGKKDPKDPRLISTLRKAYQYYVQWIERGRASGDLAKGAEDIVTAADRLVAIGSKINHLGDSMIAVIDFPEIRSKLSQDKDYWKKAVEFYSAVLKSPFKESLGTNIWTVRVKIGRCLAILEDWNGVVQEYRVLIEAENFVNPLTGKLNVSAARQKPDLIMAYAGYGFAQFQVGQKSKDEKVLSEAADVFVRIKENTEEGSRLWWFSRYMTVAALYEKGDYSNAKLVVDSIYRNFPNWDDGKFALGKKFDTLKSAIDLRAN